MNVRVYPYIKKKDRARGHGSGRETTNDRVINGTYIRLQSQGKCF